MFIYIILSLLVFCSPEYFYLETVLFQTTILNETIFPDFQINFSYHHFSYKITWQVDYIHRSMCKKSKWWKVHRNKKSIQDDMWKMFMWQIVHNLDTSVFSKVHIFWEGHQFLWNLHRRFVLCSNGQIYSGDFANFCGLLRIYEL